MREKYSWTKNDIEILKPTDKEMEKKHRTKRPTFLQFSKNTMSIKSFKKKCL